MKAIDKLKIFAKQIKPVVKAEEKDDKTIITLSGVVGEPMWFDDDNGYFNATKVRKLVGEAKGDILIRLNSAGGDVFEGIEIFNFLKNLDNHVTIEVTALAASAASIIAMGADELIMDTGSQLMIHRASTFGYGNTSDFEKTSEVLAKIDDSIIDIYKTRVSLSDNELMNMVDSETWMSADEAVEKGFADKKQGVAKLKGEEKPKATSDDKVKDFLMALNGISTRLDKLEASALKEETPVAKKEAPINKLFGGKK